MAVVQVREQSDHGGSAPGTLQSLFLAKTYPPPLPSTCLSRPTIQDKLRSFKGRRATTVVAPAGAGKSTLLAEFANSSIGPVFWYTVDEIDASDQRLLIGLSTSLRQRSPAARSRLEHISAIVGELSRSVDRRTLIVDDIHQLKAGSAVQALASLLRYLPGSCHVVLAGRDIPRGLQSIVDWFAGQRQLGELSWSDLQLTDLDRANAATVFPRNETSRWILAWAQPNGLDLGQFIEREILGPLDPQSRGLIRRLTVLPDFDVGLAAAVMERSSEDALRFLETMRRTTPLLEVDDSQTFRFGATARAGLAATLRSDERLKAQLLAGQYLVSTDPTGAAEFFLDSGHPVKAADALERVPVGEWFSQAPTARHALLDRLGDGAVQLQPNLLVARTAAMSAWQGRHEDALALLDSSAIWNSEPNRVAWGEYVRARALLALGRQGDARQACHALREQVQRVRHAVGASVSVVASLLGRLAIVEHLVGETTAVSTAETGLALCETSSEDTSDEQVLLHHTRGFIAHRDGDLKTAYHHIRLALDLCSKTASVAERASLYHVLSDILRGRGEFTRAVTVLERGLREPSLPQREQGLLTLQLAHTLADLEDFRGAVRRYRTAAGLLSHVDRDNLYPRSLSGKAMSYAQLGLLQESAAALRELEQQAGEPARYDWYLAVGVHSLCSGKMKAAVEAFESALKISGSPGGFRDRWQAYLLKAQAHLKADEAYLARAAIADGLALLRDAPVPCVGLWVCRPVANLLAGFVEANGKNGLMEVLQAAGVSVSATRIRQVVSRVASLSVGELANGGPRTAVAVDIRLLGTPSILVNGCEIRWPYGFRHKAIEAFWYVASRRVGVSSSRLATDLFPDSDEQTALRTTKVALSELRAFLRNQFGVPGETVLTRGLEGKIAFCPDAIPGTCRVDLDELGQLADDLKRRGRSEASEASLTVFRGEFLAGNEAEWIQPKRRYWTSLSIRVLGTLARRAEESGYLEQAVGCYQRMLDLDPTLETPHVALMKLFHAAGDVQARDSQMWLYSRIRKDELDAEPSQVVQELYRGLTTSNHESVDLLQDNAYVHCAHLAWRALLFAGSLELPHDSIDVHPGAGVEKA